MKTDEIVSEIQTKFSGSILKEIHFLKETTLELRKENLREVLSFLKGAPGFEVLMDLTAVDYLEPEVLTKVVYLLHNPTNFERLRVAVKIEREKKSPLSPTYGEEPIGMRGSSTICSGSILKVIPI